MQLVDKRMNEVSCTRGRTRSRPAARLLDRVPDVFFPRVLDGAGLDGELLGLELGEHVTSTPSTQEGYSPEPEVSSFLVTMAVTSGSLS